jgi:hypothetical protein
VVVGKRRRLRMDYRTVGIDEACLAALASGTVTTYLPVGTSSRPDSRTEAREGGVRSDPVVDGLSTTSEHELSPTLQVAHCVLLTMLILNRARGITYDSHHVHNFRNCYREMPPWTCKYIAPQLYSRLCQSRVTSSLLRCGPYGAFHFAR